MSIEKARELVGSLLIPQTYTELQIAENDLRDEGITIKDDFILTDKRKNALSNIKQQFGDMKGPTIIMAGWYGSGKTALLSKLIKEMQHGNLIYGDRQLDTILIQLNVQNTLSLFLSKLFTSISDLKDPNWLIGQYSKARKFIDLPDVIVADNRELVELLVQMPSIHMTNVAQFLDELFKQYKFSTAKQRILTLVIDELENITAQSKLEGSNKLIELLRIIIDNAVREYRDHMRAIKDPNIVVIFSIISRKELAMTEWFRQDTLERMKSVEYDVNLTGESSEFLMKEILRIYFSNILDVMSKTSEDGRISDWHNRLNSAKNIDEENYTYPIKPEVHQFFVNRLLRKMPDGSVLTFRAYQVGIYTLLNRWSGTSPIDLSFMVRCYEELVHELDYYPGGVQIDNLIGVDQIQSHIDQKMNRLKRGQRYQLTNITHLAIIHGRSPVVPVTYNHLLDWLPQDQVPSIGAFEELLNILKYESTDEWDVSVDTINVYVQVLVSLLSERIQKPSKEMLIEQLVRETSALRNKSKLADILSEWLAAKRGVSSKVDEFGIVQFSDSSERGQLIGNIFVVFNDVIHQIAKKIDLETALSPAIVFRENEEASGDVVPFVVSVLMPTVLKARGPVYASKINDRIRQYWDQAFGPLITTISRLEKRSSYDAFLESIKSILILSGWAREERNTYKDFDRDLRSILLEIQLYDRDKEKWISSKLGFSDFHSIENTRQLVKVLSWRGPSVESILYDNSDDVKPKLLSKFDVALLRPEEWKAQVKSEWAKETYIDGNRLIPFNEWGEDIRELCLTINRQLREKSLSFYEVGKITFGRNARVDNLDKARASLHLLLKLGQITPLNWIINDDARDYKDIQVISGDLRQRELKQQLIEEVQLKLKKLILVLYSNSKSNQTETIQDIDKILELKAVVEKDAQVAVMDEYRIALANIRPERQELFSIDPDFIRGFPPNASKQAEYLDKIDRIIANKSALSHALSEPTRTLVAKLSVDIACESLLNSIDRLYKNWGKDAPFKWKKNRFIAKLYNEYDSGLGRIPNWEKQKQISCESDFSKKLGHLTQNNLADQIDNVLYWLSSCANEIINPEWQSTFNEQDLQKYELLLEDAITQTTSEIEELINEVAAVSKTAKDFENNPLFTNYLSDLREYRHRMTQNNRSLSQIKNSFEIVQFGSVLDKMRDDLKQWTEFEARILQAQLEAVDSWLKDRPELIPLKDNIVADLNKTSFTILQLVHDLEVNGIDPVKELLEGDANDVLAIFAAAQLLQALERGEVN